MPLTLRAVSLNDVPLTQPISSRFDASGGTIGRADDNTMALPDPERHISRLQARISVTAAGYAIENTGAANPIVVGNERLLKGESTRLADRDQIRIGGYLLEVVEDFEPADVTQLRPASHATSLPAAAPPDARAAPPRPVASRTPLQRTSSLGEFNTPLSRTNPFAGLLGEAVPPPAPRPTAARASPSGGPARLPDDFDPFAQPREAAAPARPAEPVGGGSVFGDLIPDGSGGSLDELFGLQRAGGRDALASFVSEAPAPQVEPLRREASPLPSSDPMAMFDLPEARMRTSTEETTSDHAAELRSAFRPPRPMPLREEPATPAVVAASPPREPVVPREPEPVDLPVRPAVAASSPSAAHADSAALWAAFCEGAGIHLERPQGLDAAQMRMLGTLMRSAVDGTMQLISVRAATRHELHAQVTVIRTRDNNPLKFSPDAQAALEQLLEPAIRGFLAGPEAMTDAMNDLVGHAIGTVAGMRAALEGVLGRFGPRELEAKLVHKSVLDSVLPMNRKAKLWELYLQHYEGIRDEAQEDFHALFGKAFLAAYEQQLERLRRDKTPSFE